MTTEDLKNINLKTKIYHPFFGEGKLIKITEYNVSVRFENHLILEFKTNGQVGVDHFLNEIFTQPVVIKNL